MAAMRAVVFLTFLLPLPCLPMPVLAQEETAVAAEKAAPAKIPFLRPSGSYADLPEIGFDPTSLLTGGGGPPKAFYALLDAIDGLAKAESDTALLDLSRPFGLNLAQLREVERRLARVRAQGKRIVAYLENGSPLAVQLAALCDRVVMADMAMLDCKSPSLSVTHFKDLFDLVGVQAEMTRVGEFKGAVEPFVLSEMSPALREHYAAMLASMNEDIVRRIASGRGLSAAQVRELQGRRLLRAAEAKASGLVDAVVPWEGAERALRRELGRDDVALVDAMPGKKARNRDLFAMLSEMFRARRDDDEIEEPELVVLHLAGGIGDGDKAQPGSMVSGPSVKTIDELAGNEHVKGVVVRINSPGGSATASEAIRSALARLAARKPVVFSMGEVAASGGYWITCIGRPIVAEAGTITGSIGVFSLRFQAQRLMQRLGIHGQMVVLDESAAMDAIDRPWSDVAKARIQAFVDDVYDRFVALVADSRKLPADTVRGIAGGRVWSGAQAVQHGLVDAIGGLDDALALVRKEAGVGDDLEVRHVPKPRDLASSLMEQLFDASALAAIDPRLPALLQGLGRLDGLLLLAGDALAGGGTGRVYALLPADLRVR
jgi:protease-4